jgi:sugar fermentation stimulation protein A
MEKSDKRGGGGPPKVSIPFPPLTEGVLIRRYKRFLADVRLPSGEVVTAHTPNTGSMASCSEPGRKVYLSYFPNPKRKYPHGWELIRMDAGLVGVNTSLPNKLARLSLEKGALPGFPQGGIVRSEVKKGVSRLDLSYEAPSGHKTYVEVKNCSLTNNNVAYFPDAQSLRAQRHLRELLEIARQGDGALILIMVQRQDASLFSPADHIDPAWGKGLRESLAAGVKLLVMRVNLSLKEATLGDPIPYEL